MEIYCVSICNNRKSKSESNIKENSRKIMLVESDHV